jgi:polyvinyl alcohol dehydrogenase (cytochrome)
MGNVGRTMTREEREGVAAYLGAAGASGVLPAKAYCTDRSVTLSSHPKSEWNGWSPTTTNTRYQSGAAAGLSIEQVKHLKLKWAFGFDGDIIAFAQATVVDKHLFVGSANGQVQALDVESGCVHWIFEAMGPVRSAVVVAPLGDKQVLLFGDQLGWFYSLEPETGRLLWKKKIEPHESARSTGSPVVYHDTVFVPVSSWEEARATSSDYACCTFRGSVLALRIKDGSQVWKTYMIRETAKRIGKNKAGIEQWGPSGASVWGTPTLDAKRSLLYVTTGDNFSAPPTNLSDSIVAMELATGRIVWSKQTTPGDVWNAACNRTNDCPGLDYDYGSSVLIEKAADGRELLLAGQKSGIAYALDPERKGEVVWQVRVGKGGVNGGIQWGMASDGQKIYAATSDAIQGGANPDPSDPRPLPLDPKQGGGLTALRIGTGEKVWYTPPVACGPKRGCSPAQTAAVTAIPNVVFSGSMDGHLRAYSSEDGKVVWDFDTVRSYETVNGVRATGGALNGPGAVVVGGMVFVNSGYGRSGGMLGNVFLAFAPEQ